MTKTNISLQKIISGGQTGVDRAALDCAIALKIAHGGWCPKNRRAEDGVIPLHYQLQETASRDYAERTWRNVHDLEPMPSDALIAHRPEFFIHKIRPPLLMIRACKSK